MFQLAPKTLNGVGWEATAPLRFTDFKQVAFEKRNPTFPGLCCIALCLTQPTIFHKAKRIFF
ncbi:MAG: hypothetical protein V7K41_07250 [Nostoc sp.]|uniref:hypothetical protein n=1 Tax=Nostoc sp. TaxID=1180 RepID=UPI002FF87530